MNSDPRRVGASAALAMVFHNHQPVGNFPEVMDQAVENAYRPFLALLDRYPALRVTLHYSGPLLLHLRRHHPELLAAIAGLAQAGRIELLSSGFGEPILPAIPRCDRVRQLRRMNREIEELFAQRPLGAWVTERVFAPECIADWLEAGIRYILLDDCHMIKCGLAPGSPAGPWRMVTPDGMMLIFFSDSRLRNEMPWGDAERLLRFLDTQRQNGGGLMAVGDDGEKFGDWPGTRELCYGKRGQDGWLERFFRGLETLSGEMECGRLGEYLDRPPLGDVQVPAGSYHEMNLWAAGGRNPSLSCPLKPWEEKRLSPASWFHFPRRYRESGTLLSRLQSLSLRAARIPDEELRRRVDEDLHLAQCNCAWWHGVFGGVYLPHLRMALHERRICAEKTLDWVFARLHEEMTAENPPYGTKKHLDALRAEYFLENWNQSDLVDTLYTYPLEQICQGRLPELPPCLEWGDYDFDGMEEAVLRGSQANAWIDPGEGGVLFGLDLKAWNYDALAVMTRQREEYHAGLKYPDGQTMVFDPCRRAAFRDRLLADPDLAALQNQRFTERGDLYDGPWEIAVREAGRLELVRQGRVAGLSAQARLDCRKSFALQENQLRVEYDLNCQALAGLRFVPEIHLMLMATDGGRHLAVDGRGVSLAEAGEFAGPALLSWVDPWLGLRLELDAPQCCRFLHAPVYTFSRNFDELERIFQGIVLWPLIDPLAHPRFQLTLRWTDA